MSGIRRRRRFLALARHHSLSQQSLRQRIREWATERGLVMIIGDDRANIVSGSLSLSLSLPQAEYSYWPRGRASQQVWSLNDLGR